MKISPDNIKNMSELQINFAIKTHTSGNFTYIGSALPKTLSSEAQWKIKRIYDNGIIGDGNMTDIRFADGSTDFDKIWDSRTSYNYIDEYGSTGDWEPGV
jgi:hypothetical protein